ncbi:unnamed protein product [Bemisia tabaci]|uniref:Uncharacterized protein n=1 Tax=Bemisia tabaci TaxID=7038 RepID=A0A9P0CCR1_BEMTA|nr:unnamed protein product [Bemisia tabaci]
MISMKAISLLVLPLYTLNGAESIAESKVHKQVISLAEQNTKEENNEAIRSAWFTLFKNPRYENAERVETYVSRTGQENADDIEKKMIEENEKVIIPRQILVETSGLKQLHLDTRGFRAPDLHDRRQKTLLQEDKYDYEAPDTRRYPDDRGMTFYSGRTTSKYFPDFYVDRY